MKWVKEIAFILTLFFPVFPFDHPWKQNFWFSDVFMGIKRVLGKKRLNEFVRPSPEAY